ncbi:GNAT family N-acetyltransferase [Flagellimonas nanhaiensis]|uniref:GNAT family N-acetyltransferase n=1 Tax=Flagellimonas nanhaiensis TaxID=2292706 RepID=A0A371JQ66_9FLAO|nr:GNAT family N-acetyltransferase [Allomuricauda nanhaiensis]RDY59573.1 GNAT family N-acetyltransferase [Allomuricauda nanhaiensis]
MVRYKQASTKDELEQILLLQQENLPINLSFQEQSKEGFVTVEHSMEILKEMNDECGHIIALDNEKVIGYALCMHPKFGESIEVLKPMFAEINKILLGKSNYMVMGQICVAKSHRGKGVFRKLYLTMKKCLPLGIDKIITEVDEKNQRSLMAHEVIGFKNLAVYQSGNTTWRLIVL